MLIVILVNIIGPDVNTDIIADAVNTFFRRVNMVLGHFPNVNTLVRYRLFNTFCMSLYGCQLWDFSSKYIKLFYVAWRKSIRRLLDVPYRTHSVLLNLICNDDPIDVKLHRRFNRFVFKVLHSPNSIVQLCGHLAINGSKSTIGNNISFICNKYQFNRNQYFHSYNIPLPTNSCVTDLQTAGAISDIIYIKDNLNKYSFTPAELDSMLSCLCVE